MTRIEIGRKGNAMSIEARGHAGFADFGNDIVCAGISTLLQTLIAYASEQRKGIDFCVREGHLWIYTEDIDTINASMPIITGLKMIESSYPDYVMVSEGCPIISGNPVK